MSELICFRGKLKSDFGAVRPAFDPKRRLALAGCLRADMVPAVWVIILASSNGYPTEEAEVKLSIALLALLTTGLIAASTERAGAVVYCQYIEYPADCVVRPGVEVAPTQDVRKIPPSIDAPTRGSILRQDLFDRNNPNNLRSDWPGPRAQPGQF